MSIGESTPPPRGAQRGSAVGERRHPDADPQPLGSRRALRLALGGMLATAAGLGIGRFVYTPILPSMVDGLHMARTTAGLIASSHFIGYLVGAIAAAAPRLPGRRAVWVGGCLAWIAVSMALMAISGGLGAFMALRFTTGVASAFVLILGSGLVIQGLATLHAQSLGALHFAGVGAGIALSALLIPGLHGAGVGWRGQWGAAALACAVAVPAVWWLLDEPPSGREADDAGKQRLPGAAAFIVAYGLCGLAYSVTATFIITAIRFQSGSGAPEAATWAFVGLAAIPSVWVWSGVGRRFGPRRSMAAASCLQALGTSAGVLGQGLGWTLLSAAVLGGTFMGLTALSFAVAQRLAPVPRRRMNAVISAAFGVGQVVGPAMAGVLADRTNSFAAPTLAAAAAGLIAATILAMQSGLDRS